MPVPFPAGPALLGGQLIGARQVPHFWLQLISVILALLIGFLFFATRRKGW